MNDQKERLQYLCEAFVADSEDYQDLIIPQDDEEKRILLRSLMNIRQPGPLDSEVLQVQDAYLQEVIREKGIVELGDIPPIKEEGSDHLYGDKISLWQGDITTLACEAIVNAANAQMLGCFIPMHTCIDNCIHTYAGVQLRAECAAKMKGFKKICGLAYEQPTAIPLMTDSYDLPCQKIIHVVGPIVEDEVNEKLRRQLAACYRNVLDLCADNGIRSVAFCCLSTGVFRFPNDQAAAIAVATVEAWLSEGPERMDRIIFNVFKDEDRYYYEQALSI